MGLFRKLFPSRRAPSKKQHIRSEELVQLGKLDAFLGALLKGNHYVAKSEYLNEFNQSKELINWFKVLETSNTLEEFSKTAGASPDRIRQAIARYDHFESLIEAQNEQFIQRQMLEEKEYLDHILNACDPNILLDDNQRRVVLTDEDYCLVVAGAGAGKTTTVAAKVKYLVEKQHIDPKEILVISFTNKAVNELKQHINKELGIDCPIATFHSTGNAILHIHDPEKLNIVDDNKLYFVVRDYFRESVLRNESVVNNLILFFASYFDTPYEGRDLKDFFNHIAKANYTTMRSELDEFKKQVIDIRTRKAVTIQSEIMRSNQEVEIANFLYLNGIDYDYEPLYPYHIQFSRKPYTPDFRITQGDKVAYIEHFGITEDGRNDRYSEEQLKAYKKAINDKIALHQQHQTTLLFTYSSYNDQRPFLLHLKEQLEDNGFVLQPRSNKEVLEKLIVSEENRYIRKLVNLVVRFISNFKTDGFTGDDFNRMYHATQNVRTRLFLNICQDCYLEYERYLKENQAVDFQDMINESARLLREVKEMKQRLNFKYIIVDEYQDISRQRFDLVSAIHEVTDAKIIAVGDDWQSIYAFSGSDITLFTKFAEKMGYAKLLKIIRTYRNSQEVIDIAGNFIQKNREQIEKDLISPKHIEDPVIIYTYDSRRKDPNGDRRSGVNYAIADAVDTALGQIIAYNKKEGLPYNSSILLLGRYNFDGDMLEKSGLFEYENRGNKLKSVKYPGLNITFMTAHASKGLGYDNVIVINGRNELYGFPSKIENDPVLSLVIKEDRSIEYAEERRLFYVAMTRTKNRVFFIAPEENPSEFLLEIQHDFKNVSLKGWWNKDPDRNPFIKKSCPICGYPMQFRYKPAYGLRLYICTNEPEVCGFMTNEYKAGKLSIIKCDQCRDGYLIVKPGKETASYMLGCTNYKKNGTGCNRTMAPAYYYKAMGITDETPAAPLIVPKGTEIKPKNSPDSVKLSQNKTESMNSQEPEEVIIQPLETKEILYDDVDLNLIVHIMLQCLSDISHHRFYDEETLLDVLSGSLTEKVLSGKLNEVEGFGKLQEISRETLFNIDEWLIKKNFVLRTKGNYPVLHPTYNGMHYNEEMTRSMLLTLKRELEKKDFLEEREKSNSSLC